MIFLISFEAIAIIPAIIVVKPPNHKQTNNIVGLYSNINDDLINKYIPYNFITT